LAFQLHDDLAFEHVKRTHGRRADGPCLVRPADTPPRKAGQTFYEGPADVHVVGRNASNTEPARIVVVLLKAKGAPVLTPVKE
jgi:hypothetical protein